MNSNSPPTNTKRLTQVTEQLQPPVHVPVMLGNECFIVTQQDIRRIEDTRLLSYSKLTAKGELIPMESLGHDINIQEIIFNAYNSLQSNNYNPLAYNELMNLLNNLMTEKQQAMSNSLLATEMANIKASLQQQLQWSKMPANSSMPFPFTQSQATTTHNPTTCCNCCHCLPCCSMQHGTNNSQCCTRGCNPMEIDNAAQTTMGASGKTRTTALEQLKQNKISQDKFECSYIS